MIKNRCLSSKIPYTTNLKIELNNAMLHYNEIFIEKTTRKKQQQKKFSKSFHGRNSYLNLKAPGVKVILQSDKTLTAQI